MCARIERHSVRIPHGTRQTLDDKENTMDRREFLGTGVGASAALALGGLGWPDAAGGAAGQDTAKWRAFEVTARVEIASPAGVARAWVPLPLTADTDYQKGLG